MARFLVDVPVEDVRKLDEIAKRDGKSRAGVLREAVANYLALGNNDWLDAGFGLWAKYGFTEDGMDYQNRLRNEWVREWDSDYDPTKHGPLNDEKDVAA
jgi:Ribbon-helix-helix protein, copG family